MGVKLTDEEVVSSLSRAGVPRLYQQKDISLLTAGSRGKAVLQFLDEDDGKSKLMGGGVVEFACDGLAATDPFFLTVRALIGRSTPVAVVQALSLRPDLSDRTLELLNDNRVLAVTGLSPKACNPFSDYDRQSIEWRLFSWLLDGKGLILLNDCQIADSPIWSRRFKELVRNRLALSV